MIGELLQLQRENERLQPENAKLKADLGTGIKDCIRCRLLYAIYQKYVPVTLQGSLSLTTQRARDTLKALRRLE